MAELAFLSFCLTQRERKGVVLVHWQYCQCAAHLSWDFNILPCGFVLSSGLETTGGTVGDDVHLSEVPTSHWTGSSLVLRTGQAKRSFKVL